MAWACVGGGHHLGRTVLWVNASVLYGVREHPERDIAQITLHLHCSDARGRSYEPIQATKGDAPGRGGARCRARELGAARVGVS